MLKPGTQLRWECIASKTAAGTGVPTWNIRFGTNGSVADTARVTWTGLAQTAAIDDAHIIINAIVRATGASTVVQGGYRLSKRNGVSGFTNDEPGDVKNAVSTGFDSTPANTVVGISVNNGTAGNWTFHIVAAQATNLL
jgi:hypothetical protein